MKIMCLIRHLYGVKIIPCQSQRCGVNNESRPKNKLTSGGIYSYHYVEDVIDDDYGEDVNDDDIDARGGAFELEFGFALDNLSHPVRAEKRDF